jgi:hypothetical protein
VGNRKAGEDMGSNSNELKKIALVVLVVIVVIVLLMQPTIAFADPGPTPTPGAPGGDHGFPVPNIPSIESLKEKYGIPEDSGDLRQINLFWDIDYWLSFAESSRISVWFVMNRTWSILTIIMVLFLILSFFRSISKSVYGSGVEAFDRFDGSDSKNSKSSKK